MLMVMIERKQIGSTDHDDQEVAIDPDTIHRMVPNGTTDSVTVRFDDGESTHLVGSIRELVDQINGVPLSNRVRTV